MEGEGKSKAKFMNFASIDIGSNTLLLLIASLSPEETIRPLIEKAEITRLGEKLDSNGTLQPEAMERTLKVLRQFTDLCHRNEVERIACVGTDALRRAHNANEFAHRVQQLCGFKVEIIPGKKEAELAYLSAMLDFGDIYSNLVVLDIGGGSTEIIWRKEILEDAERLQMFSMKMGAVRLTEHFVRNDPITDKEYNALVQAVEERLTDLDPLPPPPSPITLVALAGTVTTLSAIHQKLTPYDPQKIQGSRFTYGALKEVIDELKNKNLEERKKMPGMEPKRADVLLAGAVILEAVMRKFKIDHVIVSDHGIRYGLFYQRFVASTSS
jgi:exopolyphosphatase/guanosine-5'-triphosphate,3'-diphosphate pyrophosphatase